MLTEMPFNSTISRMSGCLCKSFGNYVGEGGAEITPELELMNSCNLRPLEFDDVQPQLLCLELRSPSNIILLFFENIVS